MGRPPTKPKKLRDGFYIEVRNKRSSSGVKVRRDTREQMHMAIKEYERTKDVIVIGEIQDGIPIDDPEVARKAKAKAKAKQKVEEEPAEKAAKKAAKKTLLVGIDLGTSRSSISADNGKREWVQSYVGWPKDFIARKVVGKPILFGEEAVSHRLSLDLYRPLKNGVIKGCRHT